MSLTKCPNWNVKTFCRNLIDDYSVRAGSNANYEGGTVHRVTEWAYHENYVDQAYWYNDIAVLKVYVSLHKYCIDGWQNKKLKKC
jgi:hypothetical protein